MAVEIVRTQQSDRYERDGSVVREILVTYWAGPKDGPYTKRFPEGTSGAVIRAAIDEHARELEQLRQA